MDRQLTRAYSFAYCGKTYTLLYDPLIMIVAVMDTDANVTLSVNLDGGIGDSLHNDIGKMSLRVVDGKYVWGVECKYFDGWCSVGGDFFMALAAFSKFYLEGLKGEIKNG